MIRVDEPNHSTTLPVSPTGPSAAREPGPANAAYLWVRAGFVVCALLLLFRFSLVRLWEKTNPFTGDPDWGHAVYVPLVGVAYLWVRRERLRQTRIVPCAWGLLPLLGGILLFAYGIGMYRTFPGLSDFVQDTGMVMTLFGTVLALLGRRVMKIAWFPILYLFCAVPWPPSFHDQITVPLQHFAATASVMALQCVGMNVEQAGNRIVIYVVSGPPRMLEVAEACSGLRSLVTLIAVASAIGFLTPRPLARQIVIAFLAIPVAILSNVIRIVGQGLLDHYVSQKASEGFYHQCVGMVMVGLGLLMLLAGAWVVDHLFVRSPEEPKPRRSDDQRAVGTVTRCLGGLKGSVYVAVVCILVVSAVAMNSAAMAFQLHFQKVSVPLARPLTEFPSDLGHWHRVTEDAAVDSAIEEKLGTNVYIFRDYVDDRMVGHKVIEGLRAASPEDRLLSLAKLRAEHPGAVLSFGLTYYTGKVDSVAHIPERCYVGAGTAAPSSDAVVQWPLGTRDLSTRLVRFDGSTSTGSWTVNVAYFYQVNGRYETEPWQVRRSLMNIFEKSSYYAKFELTTITHGSGDSDRVMADFASLAVPEAEKCLPDNRMSK